MQRRTPLALLRVARVREKYYDEIVARPFPTDLHEHVHLGAGVWVASDVQCVNRTRIVAHRAE